ncbi:DUF3048 C-terminal domain-containing protein [uncultured Jatrophihabitans sp.]|uniref:DUF3048 C-terminal domain-containing protein n=1 Tax=uncultured Jatrophihabitans sp. TaxID=1610747 RepID=UPI0035CA77C0
MTTSPRPGGRRTSCSARVAVGSIASVALLGLAACTGGSGGAATDSRATPSSTSPAAATSSPAPVPAAKNPLTGIGAVPRTPVIAVKIDDTAPGRPQVGIDKADIVYIEAVEGGLDRIAAIFGSNKPKSVGYVRSTRPSDPELLRQYGKITEAFSGGQSKPKQILRAAGLTEWNFGAGASFYQRVSRYESDYINVVLDLAQVAKRTKTAKPTSNGWRFNPSLAGLPVSSGTRMDTVVTGSYSSGTPVQFRWNATLQKYVRYIDGVAQRAADGKLITATNVIVQSCLIDVYEGDRDVNGNPAQFTHSIGSGAVSVFRQGKRVNGTWSRKSITAGTTLTASNGKPLTLNPGNTWVVLIRKGIPVNS